MKSLLNRKKFLITNCLMLVGFNCISSFCNAQQLADCASCSTEKIASSQIKNKSADELRLLVNDLYARHGYRFKDYRYQEYFESQKWYIPISDNQNIVLSALEKQNIAFFQQQISHLITERSNLMELLKKFKTAYRSADVYDLQKQFDFKYTSDEQKNLTTVLDKIDLNDINWYKNTGLYQIVVDNGFVKIEYTIKIEGFKIQWSYNYKQHSQIIKDFDTFTSYRSENEYYVEWQFEYYNNTLKYIRMNVAG